MALHDDILGDFQSACKRTLEAMKADLAKLRTGRASTAILDHIRVDYYGEPSPLNQVATLNVPEPRLIVIKPWDKSMVNVIDTAIRNSDLGLNPVNDGEVVRVPFPDLTEERRRELTKLVHKTAEEIRVSIRGHRRDANDMLKELEKEKEITEDELRRAMENVQKTTDEWIKKVDDVVAGKEKELMSI